MCRHVILLLNYARIGWHASEATHICQDTSGSFLLCCFPLLERRLHKITNLNSVVEMWGGVHVARTCLPSSRCLRRFAFRVAHQRPRATQTNSSQMTRWMREGTVRESPIRPHFEHPTGVYWWEVGMQRMSAIRAHHLVDGVLGCHWDFHRGPIDAGNPDHCTKKYTVVVVLIIVWQGAKGPDGVRIQNSRVAGYAC